MLIIRWALVIGTIEPRSSLRSSFAFVLPFRALVLVPSGLEFIGIAPAFPAQWLQDHDDPWVNLLRMNENGAHGRPP